MDSWSFLDIEPTGDILVIKKAYAKKLKIYHPEEDPKGYQSLRQAYDNAVKYAKGLAANKERETYETAPIIDTPFELQSDNNKESFSTEAQIEYEENPYPPIDMKMLDNQPCMTTIEEKSAEFLVQVEALYNDFFSRIDIKNWKILLNNDLMWNIENKNNLSGLMLKFLKSHHYLPQDVWILLNDNFCWCNRDNSIHDFITDEFINYIHQNIEDPNPLKYCFFKPIEGLDYEKFLEYREKAFESIWENDVTDAKFYLERANTIYQNDPDLHRLEGVISFLYGNIDNAICEFNKAIRANPNDFDAILYRANAYYEKKQFNEALEAYSKVYSRDIYKNELMILMGNSYYRMGDLGKAKHWALQSLKVKSYPNEAKFLISQINLKIRSKIIKDLEKDPSNEELKNMLNYMNKEVLKDSENITDNYSTYEKIKFKIFAILRSKFVRYTLWTIYTMFFLVALLSASYTAVCIFLFVFIRRLFLIKIRR
ncbi:MAG: hypothetical protein ACM3X7_08500 [Solirubrobacterales bacterium]